MLSMWKCEAQKYSMFLGTCAKSNIHVPMDLLTQSAGHEFGSGDM